mgnify:CR=1 FL=1
MSEHLSKVREEYCEYLMQRMQSSFNLNDWHEQTYGKPLSDDDRKLLTRDVVEEFIDDIEDIIPAMNAANV